MGAPVSFSITIASLPPGFTGDPQALATAIAERLTITPSEPWSSFINGGAQPSSDEGPFLAGGLEWKVWSTGLGTYTFATQNGAGLVAATVTLAKMANDTPNSVYTYDATGRPVLISGTQGQVVSADATGLPVFANPATGQNFFLKLSTAQSYVSDGVTNQVLFDTTASAIGVTPDLANFRIPIPASSTWFFGASLQIENISGPTSTVQHFLSIRPYQNTSLGLSSVHNYATAVSRDGINTSGIYSFVGAGYVDVGIASTDPSPGLHFQVSANGNSTRFYGFRLF